MKECHNCGKEFLPVRFHPNQKCCSHKCARAIISCRQRGIALIKEKLICAVCDQEFIQKRLNNTEYCSQSCKKLGTFRKFKGLPVKGPRKHIRGTGHITKTGYRVISKNHPNARMRSPSSGKGQIMEHTWVMSNHIGRPLFKHETVHHINGIRNDNRIENLELWSSSHPYGQRIEDKIEWAKQFLNDYGYDVIKREK